MKAFLAELWPVLTGRSQNPVYRRELARWSAVRAWRRLGVGVPLVVFGVVIPVLGLPMAVILPAYLFPVYPWSTILIAGLAILISGSELVKQAASLIAVILAAQVMDENAEQVDLLRLTGLTDRQIVLAKLGAVLRPVWPLIVVSVAGRVLILFLLNASGGLSGMRASLNLAYFSLSAQLPAVVVSTIYSISLWGFDLWRVTAYQVDGIQKSVLGPVWTIYYLAQPPLDLALFTAASVWAAVQAWSRSSKLASAVSLSVILWLGGYLSERVMAAALMHAWPVFNRGSPAAAFQVRWVPGLPALDGSFIMQSQSFGIVLAIIIGLKLFVTWLLIRGAAHRLASGASEKHT